MKIDSLIRTVGSAVQQAHRDIENNTVFRFFDNYFDKIPTNSLTETYSPKMIQVEIPSFESDRPAKVVYTPVAALVHHNALNIDSVKLNLNISVSDENEDSLDVSTKDMSENSDSPEVKSGSLEIVFKCSGTPEGIARIETSLNSSLT